MSNELQSVLRRLTRSNTRVHEDEERSRSRELGGTPCADLTERRRAEVAGSIRSVSLRPRDGVPALEAELADGSGSVTLLWLGRREIAGISPGQWLRAFGLVCVRDGRKIIYNPTYELTVGPRG